MVDTYRDFVAAPSCSLLLLGAGSVHSLQNGQISEELDAR